MIFNGLSVFLFFVIISAEEYPSQRQKIFADIYVHVEPSNIKMLFSYDLTLVSNIISDLSDSSKLKSHYVMESANLTIRNLQTGKKIDHDNCNSIRDVETDMKLPFLAYHENGLFQRVQVYKNQSQLALIGIVRVMEILQANINTISKKQSLTENEQSVIGPCKIRISNVKLTPSKEGLIFEADKTSNMSLCQEIKNDDITLDNSCNSASNSETKWSFEQHLRGVFNKPLSVLTSSSIIEQLSFKPWKGSSETFNLLGLGKTLVIDKFNTSKNIDFNEENSKTRVNEPSIEENKDLFQDKDSKWLRKLYSGFACYNKVYENILIFLIKVAIACEENL